METQAPLPLTEVDMKEELRLSVVHLCGMLNTVKRLRPKSPAAAVSDALVAHLKALAPADIGLPSVWSDTAARIEARAIAEAQAEGLGGHGAARRVG